MRIIISEQDALQRFRTWIRQQGSQAATARRLKITESAISQVLHGRRRLTAKMLRPLGLRRVHAYLETNTH